MMSRWTISTTLLHITIGSCAYSVGLSKSDARHHFAGSCGQPDLSAVKRGAGRCMLMRLQPVINRAKIQKDFWCKFAEEFARVLRRGAPVQF